MRSTAGSHRQGLICRCACRHVDSAQAYKNEAAVGEAVRESGLDRDVVFISTLRACSSRVYCDAYSFLMQATKCISKTHGYESTLKGVDESLARFGFGRETNV